jgi:hypothetical protein
VMQVQVERDHSMVARHSVWCQRDRRGCSCADEILLTSKASLGDK